jgi:hypothetical protein
MGALPRDPVDPSNGIAPRSAGRQPGSITRHAISRPVAHAGKRSCITPA